jgi:hypothetical protein
MQCMVRLDGRLGTEERTTQGYRRFRCRACGKQFNERSESLLNRTQYRTSSRPWCSGGCTTNSACATFRRCS